MKLTRFNGLTGFRALAASMVFVYHYRKYWRTEIHPELLRLINEFHIGVSLFFVLSGFLISYTYEDRPAGNHKEYGCYILIRMGRIFPLYWLILTAYYWDPIFGNGHFSGLTYSLCHGFSDVKNLDGIAQAWSLTVEMTFYFLAPFLCLLQKKHFFCLIGGVAGIFIVFWAIGQVWFQINGNPSSFFFPLKFILNSSFPGRATEFLSGMILASTIHNDTFKKYFSFRFKTQIGLLGIFLTAYIIGLFQPDIFHQGTDTVFGFLIQMMILPIFVCLTLAGLISETSGIGRFFASKTMVLLGNASFAFYLVHISYVSLRVRMWWCGPDYNFILLWLIAILLYLFVEKPIYNGIRNLLGK